MHPLALTWQDCSPKAPKTWVLNLFSFIVPAKLKKNTQFFKKRRKTEFYMV
jgi:hypothetical protein